MQSHRSGQAYRRKSTKDCFDPKAGLAEQGLAWKQRRKVTMLNLRQKFPFFHPSECKKRPEGRITPELSCPRRRWGQGKQRMASNGVETRWT